MLSANAWGWLFALLVSLILSLTGLLVPNSLRQARKPRAHNPLKLWNEALARHQLGYFTFYIAAGFTVNVVQGFDKRFFALPLALTFLFFVLGVHRSTHLQDDFLVAHHQCPDNGSCQTKLGTKSVMTLLWPNAAMALVLAALAFYALCKIA